MKKAVLIIAGLTFLMVAIFAGWALFAGLSYVWEKMPQWIAGGEKVAKEVIKKAEEAVPGVKERAREVVPGLTEKVKEVVPDRIPEKDVGGEDIKGITRYPNMVRAFYEIKDQKRTIVYRGRVEFQPVVEFYKKEMHAQGFKKKIISASPDEEIHVYEKAKRKLEFRFLKAGLLGSDITELTIKEL